MTPAFCAISIPGRAIEFLVGKVAFSFFAQLLAPLVSRHFILFL